MGCNGHVKKYWSHHLVHLHSGKKTGQVGGLNSSKLDELPCCGKVFKCILQAVLHGANLRAQNSFALGFHGKK